MFGSKELSYIAAEILDLAVCGPIFALLALRRVVDSFFVIFLFWSALPLDSAVENKVKTSIFLQSYTLNEKIQVFGRKAVMQ